jgi:hypothetical protein
VATITELFLDDAQVIIGALADPRVGAAWDRPSVLEDQLVSGLAGHLARGGIWVVGDYLDAGDPAGPVDLHSAGDYFAGFVDTQTDAAHAAIRQRGARVGEVGQAELVATATTRLAALGPRLTTLGPDHLIAVIAGWVMRLEDYLVGRIVEQVVHLDDLARSVGAEPWPVPADSVRLVTDTAIEIARRRAGDAATVRALFRAGCTTGVFPVL